MGINEIFNVLFLPMAMNINNRFYFYDEKILDYLLGIVFEIDDLLDSGKTVDEIRELINNCDFLKVAGDISPSEGEIIKNEALYLLNVRYELYLDKIENEKREKVKKHLFNK